uniref:Kelch-like protein diablo n=1 Tax=Clastoptera arizonana TaxID=38151 RepID=A0A1B6D3P4_9HEMI
MNQFGLENVRSKYILPRILNEDSNIYICALNQSKFLCDATIQVENENFCVHKIILGTCSPYFRALFRNSEDTYKLDGIRSDIFKIIMDYAYMQKTTIDRDNVILLLLSADYLYIDGITRLCLDFIKEEIHLKNCFYILRFARDHSFLDLKNQAYAYIMKNFSDIFKYSPELMNSTVDELEEIIGSYDLNVKNEDIVWEAVIAWIEHDPINNRRHLARLMPNVRFGLLDPQYFIERIKDHPLVLGDDSCRSMVYDILTLMNDLDTISEIEVEVSTPLMAIPRVPHEVLFAIGGWSGGSPTSIIETYDTRADRWIAISKDDPAGPRAYHGTAVIGHNIYVIGGFNGREYYNSCRCFNAVTQTWREIGPMHEKRCYISVVTLNGFIYAIGGYNGGVRLNTVEKYDPATNQWSLVQPMLCVRSDADAATLNGLIYVTGGFNGRQVLRSVEVYDPETDEWSLIADMTTNRSGVSCIAYHGEIYAIGGFNGWNRLKSGEKFRPSRNYWIEIPEMSMPRSNFAIEVIDDMMFVIGGFDGQTTIDQVECFDDDRNEWFQVTDMNINRSAVSACVMDGLPNLHEYIYQNRELLLEDRRQRLRSEISNDNISGMEDVD